MILVYTCPIDVAVHSIPSNAKLIEILPKPVQAACPEHTPPKIEAAFLEGARALADGHPTAAASMLRKSVELTTKHLAPEAKGTLEKRIDALAEVKAILPAMADWAHEVRLGGNESVHDEDPIDPKDARKLQEFAEVFLTYAFTLPARVKARGGEPPPPIT